MLPFAPPHQRHNVTLGGISAGRPVLRRTPGASSSRRVGCAEIEKARLGFETTAWWSWSDSNQQRVLWNIVLSDQLPWSDTRPDRRGRAKATWPRRGGGCETRVLGRTRTMFHNALVVDEVSESQENQTKRQNARRSGEVSDQGSWSDSNHVP